MERLLTEKLIAWKGQSSRKPVLLDGARQVGKACLVGHLFGERCFVNIHKLLPLVLFALLATACVSNNVVQTTKPTDYQMTCSELKEELSTLGVAFEESREESGVTGGNVALAIVFWPGIIVNEMRSNRNQDSIARRAEHLSQIYNAKCLASQSEEAAQPDMSGSS